METPTLGMCSCFTVLSFPPCEENRSDLFGRTLFNPHTNGQKMELLRMSFYKATLRTELSMMKALADPMQGLQPI